MKKGNNNLVRIRISYNLVQEVKEKIKQAHISEDFKLLSLSDFIRKALIDYKNGMKLTYNSEKGADKLIAVILDDELYAFYKGLPDGKKSEIVERAIGSLLQKDFKDN